MAVTNILAQISTSAHLTCQIVIYRINNLHTDRNSAVRISFKEAQNAETLLAKLSKICHPPEIQITL